MLQLIIDMVSDFATLISHAVVGYIAEHSSLKMDGLWLFLIKIVVSVLVYLLIIVGLPLAVFLLIFRFALPLIFG